MKRRLIDFLTSSLFGFLYLFGQPFLRWGKNKIMILLIAFVEISLLLLGLFVVYKFIR